MQNWWEQYPQADSAPSGGLPSRPVYQELPPQPAPRHPEQVEGDNLGNRGKEIDNRLSIPKFASDEVNRFKSDPVVKAYRESLPVIIAATQAQKNGPGDISVIYGWAKTMDPMGSVREGDTDLAQQGSGPMQRAQFLISKYRLQEGGVLPPEVRLGLIEEMRTKGRQLNLAYSQSYKQTSEILRQAGVDPMPYLGAHAGDAFAAAEQQYVRENNEGGIGPTDPNYLAFRGETPPQINDRTAAGFDLQQDPSIASMSPEQTAAYQAWWKANPNPTPDSLNQFFTSVGLKPAPNAQEIIAAAKEGRGISTTIQNQLPRHVQERLDERLENTGGVEAGVAGGADTVSVGTFDELSALGDAVGDALEGRGFNYRANLAANRKFQEGLQDQHGGAYLAGQVAGGLVLPTFGAKTAGQLAGVGAGYGAAYGAGSGEGFGGRVGNALIGSGAGAGVGYGLGRASQYVRGRKADREIPPLVGEDGRLNEPLEVAGPAARVQSAKQFGIDLPMGAAGDRSAAILETGFDNSPVSAGLMNDARRVTEGQVSNAVEGVADRFGKARTLNEAGAAAQDGARAWMTRFEKTAAKAYDAIPISSKAPASVSNTVATIEELVGRFASNPELAKQMNSPKLEQMLGAIKKGLSWQDLKALRSRIGYEIGEQRFSDSPTKDDLRAVYGALSEDMRATASQMGPRALRAFDRANALYRQGQQRIDKALVTILGNDGMKTPEAAARAIQVMTQSKGGDLKKLAQLRSSLSKTGEWDEVASALIRIGGQPVNSEGRAFNPQTFVQWYSDMTEQARSMLFKPELRRNLDEFVAVSQRLASKNALRNTSNTAPALTAVGAVTALSTALWNPLLAVKLAGVGAANFALAKLWTQPKFVQWATGYSKMVAAGNQSAAKSHIGRLSKIATTNPQLRGAVESLQKALLSAANDNASQAGRVAASPDEGPEGQR